MFLITALLRLIYGVPMESKTHSKVSGRKKDLKLEIQNRAIENICIALAI